MHFYYLIIVFKIHTFIFRITTQSSLNLIDKFENLNNLVVLTYFVKKILQKWTKYRLTAILYYNATHF